MIVIEDSAAGGTIWHYLLVNLFILHSDLRAACDPADPWSGGSSVTCSGQAPPPPPTLLEQLYKSLCDMEEEREW